MNTQEQYDRFMLPVAAKGVQPLTIVKGRGTALTDSEGREYLDCFSGISVVNAGHGHPEILAAAREQMEQLVHCCSYVYRVPTVGTLAERLAAITPGALSKSFFGNSGAEALEGAMRLAKQATGRRELVALGYSFHGRTLATLSITGNAGRKRRNGPYMGGVAFAPPPYCYRCPLRLEPGTCGTACAEVMTEVIRRETSGDVAAFVAEPVLGEGGILIPPADYFKIVTEIFHDQGALFICDEVQSGFGRTGRLFAIEHCDGVEVDIMTMAKGIANGFPISAFIAREPVSEAMQPGDHLSTFGGNPISAAAALANIAVLEQEGLVGNARDRGAELIERLAGLRETRALVGDVRGRGLMIGVELVKDKRDKTPAPEKAKAVRDKLRQQGILIGVGGVFANVLRIQPPLCITADACQRVADALDTALGELE